MTILRGHIVYKTFFILLSSVIVFACTYGVDSPLEEHSFSSPDIHSLTDDTYYFPVPSVDQSSSWSQPLQRFDLIFVGHNVDLQATSYNKVQNLAALTPGKYTHVFAYIGKDKNGLAYGVEMNVDKRQEFRMGTDGLKISGQFYLHCLGSDFNNNSCPDNSYLYSINSYDYMMAKRLRPELRKRLMQHESQLIETMATDLAQAYPFQIPVDINLTSIAQKKAYLIDDGRDNGADCTSYFVSLFEEVADICLENVRVEASVLSDYFLNDQLGKRAVIPAKYNPVLNRTVSLNSALGEMGYTLKNNLPRQSACSQQRSVQGIPTPNALFSSPSLESVSLVSGARIRLPQMANP